jgi:general secretion pathway protein D
MPFLSNDEAAAPKATGRLVRLALPVAILLALAGCAAERDHSDGMREVTSGDREKGLALLAKASMAEPTNSQYRLDFLQQQTLTERNALSRADEARRMGNLEQARQWYMTALRVNPGSDRALRGIGNVEMDGRHVTMIAESEALMNAGKYDEARERLHKVLLENSSNLTAQKLWSQLVERQENAEQAKMAKIAANSVMKKPVSLQFRDANLRLVFEALSRTTGLNVIFDRDVKSDLKTTIFVRDASVEDTVDLILLQSQLDKKVLNANTLYIYPATAAKQKEYQDLQIRVFQLSDVDGKYMQTLLKTLLKTADMSLEERSNTLVVRGTADMIAVAEKIVAAHDQPDPEVMLEVEVLEVSHTRLTDLGVEWPSAFGISEPSTIGTLSQLHHLALNQMIPTGGLGATLNFKLEDSDANVLASPRIRVRDKEKAKIVIGDRVPVFTQQLQPLASTGASGGIATAAYTSSVNYLDVGIKLDVEPHVYREGDVGIKISMEVSNLGQQVTDPVTKAQAYQISSRTATTSLRLRDGETQILGGLINDQQSNTEDKIPGIGQFPVLNRIFGNNNSTHIKDELVLSITPHILRAPPQTDRRLRDVFSGTESAVRENPLRLDPVGSVSNSTPEPSAPVTPGFVGGGGNPSSGPAEAPPMPTDPRAAASAIRHQAPPAGTVWPPGAAAGSRPGDAAAPPPPPPADAPPEPAAAPAPAPTDAPPTAPAPAAPAPAGDNK